MDDNGGGRSLRIRGNLGKKSTPRSCPDPSHVPSKVDNLPEEVSSVSVAINY